MKSTTDGTFQYNG